MNEKFINVDFKRLECFVVLKNLLDRDADCRCGNIQLDEFEIKAIKELMNMVDVMHIHCVNNGCHMNDK